MSRDKNSKELKKLKDLAFGAPVVLQGPEILKARSDAVRLSQLAGGTFQVGLIGAVGQKTFELANPFEKKRKRGRRR